MARCGTSTPFGAPVDPDVYITYAELSLVVAKPRFSSGLEPKSSVSILTARTVEIISGQGDEHTTASAWLSWIMNAQRSGGALSSRGTYAPPHFSTANCATTNCTDRSRAMQI